MCAHARVGVFCVSAREARSSPPSRPRRPRRPTGPGFPRAVSRFAPVGHRCKVWMGKIPMQLNADEVAVEFAAYMVRPWEVMLQKRRHKDRANVCVHVLISMAPSLSAPFLLLAFIRLRSVIHVR